MDGGKWVLRDGWAIAHTGVARAWDVLNIAENDLIEDPEPSTSPIIEPPSGKFPDVGISFVAAWIRRALKNDGWRTIEPDGDDNLAPNYGCSFLVCSPARVWVVDAAFHCTPIPAHHMAALGSGADFALGAAHSAAKTGQPHALCVEHGVCAAIELDPGCGGAPWIGTLKAKGSD